MKRALGALGLAAPILAFALLPLALLLWRAAGGVGVWEVVVREQAALANTVLVSAGAAALALALGGPLSVLLFRTDLPGRRALAAILTLPSAIPAFIWAMGWVALASPKAGLLNRGLGLGLDVYGRGGIAFVLGTSGLPLVILAGAAALRRVDPALEEAARVNGASPGRALLGATLPLIWPSLLSGAVLAFLLAASAFAVPYMLGISATPPTVVATTRVYAELLIGDAHLGRALVLASALLALAPVALLLNGWLGRNARVRLAAGKGAAPRPFRLGQARVPALAAVTAVAGVLVGLPLAAIILTSLQSHFGAPVSLATLTGGHWRAALGNPRTLAAFGRSLVLATASAAAIAAFGTAIALGARRLGRWGRAVQSLALWPYSIPGTVLAMALLAAFSRDLRLVLFDRIALVLALANTPWLLVVAYATKFLALGERNASEGVAQLDPSLEEAARVSGAGPWRTLRDVTLPLLRPALLTGGVLSFLYCCTEITMSVLLVAPGKDVIGTLLFELQSYADPQAAAVLACALVLLVLAAQAALALARRTAPAER